MTFPHPDSSNGPYGCKCRSFIKHMLGDGCDECNPTKREEIRVENLETAVDDLRDALSTAMDFFQHGLHPDYFLREDWTHLLENTQELK